MWKNIEKWLITNRLRYAFFSFLSLSLPIFFHTSRHTFATLSLTAGGDLYTVSKLLGHTSINSTQVYADVVMETKIEAVNLIHKFFSTNKESTIQGLPEQCSM